MTDEEHIGSELERILGKIVALCEAATRGGESYLLSRLGKDLGEDLDIFRQLTSEKLADFLRNRLQPTYVIRSTGIHNNVLEIVQAGQAAELPIGGVLPHSGNKTHIPRFNNRFWAAFAIPLRSKHRYLNLNTLYFRDIDEEIASTEIEKEIPSSLIASDGIANRDSIILGNLAKWIEENGLRKENFLWESPTKRMPENRGDGISLLELLISTLDLRQQQALKLPLDVVNALQKKKIIQ